MFKGVLIILHGLSHLFGGTVGNNSNCGGIDRIVYPFLLMPLKKRFSILHKKNLLVMERLKFR